MRTRRWRRTIGSAIGPVVVAVVGAAVAAGFVVALAGSGVSAQQSALPPAAGYWLATSAGGVYSFGPGIPFYGSAAGSPLPSQAVAIAPTGDAKGYWLALANGAVESFGDATFLGSAAPLHLTSPIVAMAATADGFGYWLLGANGAVYSFGNGFFHGAPTGHLHAAAVAIVPDPQNTGYWVIGRDGSVTAEGAPVLGGVVVPSTDPVVGAAPTADGGGFWLLTRSGHVLTTGDAQAYGQITQAIGSPAVAIEATPDRAGYWIVTGDGGVFTYGDARFAGSASTLGIAGSAVGLAPWVPSAASTPPPHGQTVPAGAANNNKTITVNRGDTINVSLSVCATCGDTWGLREGPEPTVVQYDSAALSPPTTAGGNATQVFTFSATGDGTTEATMWEYGPGGASADQTPIAQYTITITVIG